jgi:hypothetical protein
MVGFIILGVVVVLLAVFLIGIYNSLVQLRQRVQNASCLLFSHLSFDVSDGADTAAYFIQKVSRRTIPQFLQTSDPRCWR